MCQNPSFIVDGISRLDVCQGTLGDCWLISGMVAIATVPHLFANCVPSNQDFDKNYCGKNFFVFDIKF